MVVILVVIVVVVNNYAFINAPYPLAWRLGYSNMSNVKKYQMLCL